MTEKQAAVGGEESLASKEAEYGFKERVVKALSEMTERVFMKAVEANSENIASFMVNVAEYEVNLDSIEGDLKLLKLPPLVRVVVKRALDMPTSRCQGSA